MKKSSKKLSWFARHPRLAGVGLPLCVVSLALGLAWWISRPPEKRTPITQLTSFGVPANLGPAGVLCGIAGSPREVPPIDSPFGMHLFANTPRGGAVLELPAVSLAEALMPPPDSAIPMKPKVPPAMSSVNADAARDAVVGAGVSPGPAPSPPSVPRNETGLDDVEAVSQILEEYRRAFGAMPVGEQNEEIVRRLQGENPLGIAVLPKSHPALNANGELLDRWGTPYRFHPESFWLMTVRSAGPDKRMWSNDDILSTMEEGLASLQGLPGQGGSQ
jgi:hypothetical protein